MNCFHFSVSLRYNTTLLLSLLIAVLLWIAFIFLYLWDTTQHRNRREAWRASCELLSFFCIFEIQHNTRNYWRYVMPVVNCFHFSVSLRYNTTYDGYYYCTTKLWIAFIFLYLWDTTQPKFIWYNNKTVVNCFHFSVSLRYNTTMPHAKQITVLLWIAFIFLYLWDTTQLPFSSVESKNCCELLSFFCIFEIQHNDFRPYPLELHVVNCFHFSVSLRYNTTFVVKFYLKFRLWIAFIFLYLWDTTQLLRCR